MTDTEHVPNPSASVEQIQTGWHELTLRVSQLEVERASLQHENKKLHQLIERVIEHRQKSHGELILLLTGLVSKLPINEVGVIISKLMEHNKQVCDVLSGFVHGSVADGLPQPQMLVVLDQVKRDLAAKVQPLVEELAQVEVPLENELLQSLIARPENFFDPRVVRATRCYLKGQVPRERIVREFGDAALIFFNDLTTDPKLNPRPKADEIVLAFKTDFDLVFQQNPTVIADKRDALLALHKKVQQSKAPTEQTQQQKIAFAKLTFVLELLHYYENQNTEVPEALFAQRLPGIVEQIAIRGPSDPLDEKMMLQAESLLATIITPDHRLSTINNLGKNGGTSRTLKYVLRLRAEKIPDFDEVVPEFIKHLIAPQKAPTAETLAAIIKLIHPGLQKSVIRALMATDRLRKAEAETLGRAIGAQLGVQGLEDPVRTASALTPEMERQLAWDRVKELITRRVETSVIAAAVRDRLHAKYDADEIKQSWLTLIEVEPISLIRIFCQIPYLPDGRTDSIARAVMESYVNRLTHEKYSAAYNKVVNSLRNMHKANPESPTLVNFLALVKWVDGEAANKLNADVGMVAHA